MNVREYMNANPWLGWAVAGAVIVISALVMFYRMGSGGDTYDGGRMQEFVTIKYTDTGKEEQVPRGRLIKMLLDQGGTIDATKGIINPETKQPTGFIYDKAEWEALVKQLNDDQAAAKAARGGAAPVPGK